MPWTSIASSWSTYYSDHHLLKKREPIFPLHTHRSHHKRCCHRTPAAASNPIRSRKEEKKNKICFSQNDLLLLKEICRPEISQNQEVGGEKVEKRCTRGSRVNTSNMWWVNLKGALGQSFNLEGIFSTARVVARDRHLALPHVNVPDIRWIDWAELESRGFRGVVFDKDNTLTAPYSLSVCPRLASSLQRCKSVFGDHNVAIFSNSAGLHQYDPDGSKAETLERAIGVRVLRHGVKKPAGTAEEIEKHFGCASSLLIMVGDRHFTDIVYGNRNGFLTILTKPLSPAEEPFIIKQVRKLEACLVSHWYMGGLKPTSHILLPDSVQCVKDSSIM